MNSQVFRSKKGLIFFGIFLIVTQSGNETDVMDVTRDDGSKVHPSTLLWPPHKRRQHSEMYLVPRMATALVLFVCVSNGGEKQANAQYYAAGMNSREMRMCGPMLTNTLELVCQGRFNTINKKAQDGGTHTQERTNNERDNFAIFPFRSRRNALSLNAANAFRRRTRNVVDECCHVKSCTIAEMKHYCERN